MGWKWTFWQEGTYGKKDYSICMEQGMVLATLAVSTKALWGLAKSTKLSYRKT